MLRVLVTRPEPGAGRTAKALEALGHRPVVLPLTETRPLAVPVRTLPAHIDAVAVTSANALRHAAPALIERLAALPCHAVGARTAAAAGAAGFLNVEEGPGEAQALAARMATGLAGKAVVYLCGRARFPLFEEWLGVAGVHVRPIETYDTVAVDFSSEEVAALLDQRPVDVVLLYSAGAAQAARRLAARPQLEGLLGKAAVLALSERVAEAFGPGAEGKVRVAPAPMEGALLALLPSLE